MDFRDELIKIDKKLDNIDSKLDKYQGRVSTLEADQSWVKGSIKIISTIILAVVGWIAKEYVQLIGK